jgi:hypothetical protein
MDGFEEGEEAIFKVNMDIHHRGPGKRMEKSQQSLIVPESNAQLAPR